MSSIANESTFYDPAYWFEEGKHLDCQDFGPGYYANAIYARLITRLPSMPAGAIVVLGTNRCVSFALLCERFGADRCIGFDVSNPAGHPSVRVMNCMELGAEHRVDIAFCHNDIGSYPMTPKLKLHCQAWASDNVVPGGYVLGRNNHNRAGVDVEGLMVARGFENIQLRDLRALFDLHDLPDDVVNGHMLSRRTHHV